MSLIYRLDDEMKTSCILQQLIMIVKIRLQKQCFSVFSGREARVWFVLTPFLFSTVSLKYLGDKVAEW